MILSLIIPLGVYWISLMLKKLQTLSKQKALDADSREIQQTILTGKIKANAANTRVIIY